MANWSIEFFMKRILFFIGAAALLINVQAWGRGAGKACHDRKGGNIITAAKTTMADPAEDNYDIKHIKFNLNVTDTSVYVSGDVTTTAQVAVFSMTDYVFEL